MKKRGIIERLVMGKRRDKDFTEDDLPSTRFKQFKFVFRTRFGIIFRANLLAALFCLPLLTWSLIASGYVADYTAELSVTEYASELIYLSLLQYGTEIPLMMLAFCGLAGIFYVVRRLCWGQSVKIISDFGKGLKDSWKQFLLLGLITGTVNLAVRYIVNFSLLSMSASNVFLCSLALGAAVVFALIFFLILMFALCQSSLYTLSFLRLLKNSAVLAFKRLFRGLGILLLSLAPVYIFALLPWAFVKIIGCCLAVVFSIGFAVTVQTVFCHGVFDVFINAKSYPDFVGVGLAGGKIPEEITAAAENVQDETDRGEEQ